MLEKSIEKCYLNSYNKNEENYMKLSRKQMVDREVMFSFSAGGVKGVGNV